MTISKSIMFAAIAILLVMPSGAAHATTLSDVLSGIGDVRSPVNLTSLEYDGSITFYQAAGQGGSMPLALDLSAVWSSPDDFLVNFDVPLNYGGAMSGGDMGGHPAVDHVLMSRPDMMSAIDKDWTISYTGTAIWDGDPAWALLVSPADFTSQLPEFDLLVRKDDFVPVRSIVEFADGTRAITDFEWLTIDGFLLPIKFTTTFAPAFNPDVSGVKFHEESSIIHYDDVDDDGPAVFEELYHGFADDPITADVNDPSGTYKTVTFTFSLYVEDEDVVSALDRRKSDVISTVKSVVETWDWANDGALDEGSTKWDVGRRMMKKIGELLGTDQVTDFYFLTYEII